MKILIACHFYSNFITGLIKNLKLSSKDIKIDLLTKDTRYLDNEYIDTVHLLGVPTYTSKLTKQMQKFFLWHKKIRDLDHYDVINIHFAAPFYSMFIKPLRNKSNNLITSIWGSDFYRASTKQKNRKRKLFLNSDFITFTNPEVENDFLKYYDDFKYSKKTKINRFGLTPLNYLVNSPSKIDSIKYYDFAENKTKIAIGYSADRARQHLKILHSLNKLNKDKFQYILPLTYGDKEYIQEIKDEIKNKYKNMDIILLTNYLTFEEVAMLRKATDIIINVPLFDQFSGSMQETLFAENIVINGNWLPYTILEKEGVYFEKVETIEQLPQKIKYIQQNEVSIKEKCKKNPDKIWNISSWEKNISSWMKLYKSKG